MERWSWAALAKLENLNGGRRVATRWTLNWDENESLSLLLSLVLIFLISLVGGGFWRWLVTPWAIRQQRERVGWFIHKVISNYLNGNVDEHWVEIEKKRKLREWMMSSHNAALIQLKHYFSILIKFSRESFRLKFTLEKIIISCQRRGLAVAVRVT